MLVNRQPAAILLPFENDRFPLVAGNRLTAEFGLRFDAVGENCHAAAHLQMAIAGVTGQNLEAVALFPKRPFRLIGSAISQRPVEIVEDEARIF